MSSTETSNRQTVLQHEAPKPFFIQPATSPEDMIDILSLYEAYAKSLNIDLSFQNFTTELSGLPGRYGSPSDILLLARHVDKNDAIGCVGLRPLDTEGVCEMKRLYVAPQGRGFGLGKALVKQVIGEAKRIGYGVMRLDTLGSMMEAISLYKRLGFVERKAYYDTPIGGTVFFELDLS
jgi:ribosomal protein S18 acetylase RimI-like enzyme